MNPRNKIIKYYSDCYINDNRQFGIANLLKSKLELLHFIDHAQTLNTDLQPIYLEDKYGDKLVKQLFLYHNDKKLVANFLAIKSNENKIIPIYIFPCTFSKKNNNRLNLEFDNRYLNPDFESYVKGIISEKRSSELLDTLNSLDNFNSEDFIRLQVEIEKNPEISISHFNDLPNLAIRKNFKTQNLNSIIPQLSIGLIRRSLRTRSIIRDLEKLVETYSFSNPLNAVFNTSKKFLKLENKIFSPFTLNQTQEDISKNCFKHYINLVTGPPGTGKSFTIAALALNAAINGKSVLISCKTDQAVDVIAHKIINDFDSEKLIMRGGRGQYKKTLKAKLKNITTYSSKHGINFQSRLRIQGDKINKRKKQAAKLEKKINKLIKKEMRLSQYLVGDDSNFFSKFWLDLKVKNFPKFESLNSLLQKYRDIILIIRKQEKNYIKLFYENNIQINNKKHRLNINAFNASLGAITNVKKEAYISQARIGTILNFLPIWLINIQDVGNVFPLEKELFDLVIIDEASQVDIASALPIIHRGKHLTVVGDPLQLRHVSFLSKELENNILENMGFSEKPDLPSFREASLYDLLDLKIKNPEQIYSLYEHYRSKPEIINFSNAKYYNSQLIHMVNEDSEHCLHLEFVPINGQRNVKGINQAEIDFVFKLISDKLKNDDFSQSIGILSPFRDQVDEIRRQLDDQFTFDAIKNLNIRIDTPYGFQGDERDIMMISLCIDNSSSHLVHQYLNKPGVFNVSITRARKKQIVLHSFNPSLLNSQSILKEYFGFKHKSANEKNNYTDLFLSEVTDFLKDVGIENYLINNDQGDIFLDLSFTYNEKQYVIDLIGFPGEQEGFLNINEHQLLERMNKQIIVISFAAWQLSQQKIKDELRIIFS